MPPSAAIAGSSAFEERRELSDRQLALDLHADDEEEDAHQRVVHEVAEREREFEAADANRERQVEPVLVGLGPG